MDRALKRRRHPTRLYSNRVTYYSIDDQAQFSGCLDDRLPMKTDRKPITTELRYWRFWEIDVDSRMEFSLM